MVINLFNKCTISNAKLIMSIFFIKDIHSKYNKIFKSIKKTP